MYTWSFSERSLLIKFYLWLYMIDKERRQQTTFCKLWWGMLLSPFFLPIRLVISIVFAVISFFNLIKRLCHNIWYMDVLVARRNASLDRQNARDSERSLAKRLLRKELERKECERRCEERLAWSFMAFYNYDEQGPPPPKISLPSRILDVVSERADKIVAFTQAHPEIGEKVNATVTVVSKTFVRCVFYPLMVLIPTAIIALGGFFVYKHWHGPAVALRDAWHNALGWAWDVLRIALPLAGLMIGVMVVSLSFIFLGCWLMLKFEPKEQTNGYIPKPHPPGKPARIMADGWKLLQPRVEHRLDRIGLGVWRVSVVIAKVIAFIFKPLGMLFYYIGLAFVGTFKFMIEGHHAVKNRTCPRIEIKESE
jgi:hypothetical protein